MEGTSLPAASAADRRTPKRLLALRGDDHLVARVRAGDEGAFEVAYERHAASILSFCRHMLCDAQEAEDAAQQTFISAHRDLLRNEREIRLKPWLYAIARNRCLSMLRARRERADGDPELLTAGLADEVQDRADLRELVADLHDLPEDQRAALVLTEIGDLSHAEVAEVLGRGTANVKGLVFRARSGLIERRDARDAPCEEIRVELANARHGALRRGRLRHHLAACPGCSSYLAEVRRQRRMMALILPVVPSIGLKHSVLAAVGIGGGSAAGGGGLAAAGLGAAIPTTGGLAAKVAVVGVLAGSAGVAGEAALDDRQPPPEAGAPRTAAPVDPAAGTPLGANERSRPSAASGDRSASARGRTPAESRSGGVRNRGGNGPAVAAPPGRSNERASLRRRNAAAPALGRREASGVKEHSRQPTTPAGDVGGRPVAGDSPKRAPPPARPGRKTERAERTRGP